MCFIVCFGIGLGVCWGCIGGGCDVGVMLSGVDVWVCGLNFIIGFFCGFYGWFLVDIFIIGDFYCLGCVGVYLVDCFFWCVLL